MTRPHESPECRCAGCRSFDASNASVQAEMVAMVRRMGAVFDLPMPGDVGTCCLGPGRDPEACARVHARRRMAGEE